MRRWIAAVAAALFVCALFWLGGYDFNQRGGIALLAGGLSVVAGMWAWGMVAIMEDGT